MPRHQRPRFRFGRSPRGCDVTDTAPKIFDPVVIAILLRSNATAPHPRDALNKVSRPRSFERPVRGQALRGSECGAPSCARGALRFSREAGGCDGAVGRPERPANIMPSRRSGAKAPDFPASRCDARRSHSRPAGPTPARAASSAASERSSAHALASELDAVLDVCRPDAGRAAGATMRAPSIAATRGAVRRSSGGPARRRDVARPFRPRDGAIAAARVAREAQGTPSAARGAAFGAPAALPASGPLDSRARPLDSRARPVGSNGLLSRDAPTTLVPRIPRATSTAAAPSRRASVAGSDAARPAGS